MREGSIASSAITLPGDLEKCYLNIDPDLLHERMRPGGEKPSLALRLFSLVLFTHRILAGLDRGRFHWSDDAPPWLEGICLFIVAASATGCLRSTLIAYSRSEVASSPTERARTVECMVMSSYADGFRMARNLGTAGLHIRVGRTRPHKRPDGHQQAGLRHESI